MPIYTRTGDDGQTSLGDGSRVPKTSLRVEAYGSLDEACSAVGFARSAVTDTDLDADLRFLQQRLMNCSSALAAGPATVASPQAGSPAVTADDVAALEAAIDRCTERTGPWRGFVVPSGSEAAVRLHLARAVTRRAERRLDALSSAEPVGPSISAFVNRASDLLFAAAGVANVLARVAEDAWDPNATAPD